MPDIVFTDFEVDLPVEPGMVVFDFAPQTDQYMTALARRQRGCIACTCRPEAQQVVVGSGTVDARILFLGQNPGDEEDAAGTPFIGRAGKELDKWLTALGLARARVAISNIVKCHTLKNRAPKPREIVTCRDLWLPAELDLLPAVQLVVPLGKPATEALLGAGALTPHPKGLYWRTATRYERPFAVFPLPHPAYLLRAQTLRTFFLTTVLPRVQLCWQTEWPEAYAHAARTAEDVKGVS